MQCSKVYSITSSAATKQRRWYGDAERLGGFEIDDQLVFGGSLHRQLAWLAISDHGMRRSTRPASPIRTG
jgi:hypothetical protein